jgi:hypothetical protein
MAQVLDLNIMAGTAVKLEQKLITVDDKAIWERDFALLCDDLTKLVDPDIGADLASEKPFYDAVLQIAKGYFDMEPFGGLKPAPGQFGFRLISAQDLKTAASSRAPKLWSWIQTVATTTGAYTIAPSALASAAVYTSSAANQREVLAWHRLMSYKPAPRLLYIKWTVNDYPYAPYSVEPFSKISKDNKLIKLIPMPGRIVLHPGGKVDADFYFELETGSTAPSGITNLDIEIALFGLVFGEYNYLTTAGLDATS